jgi:heme oxygenase
MRVVDQIEDRTKHLHRATDSDVSSLLEEPTPEHYRQFLTRVCGFVTPLERALLDIADLDRFLDFRRLRKQYLLKIDLLTLGVRPTDLDALPQCSGIPRFEAVHTALGWAYVIERNTISYPTLFRRLAIAIPGEVAFAASYLKCYSGMLGEAWNRFSSELERAVGDARDLNAIVAGAKEAFRAYRRWRNAFDGHPLTDDLLEHSTPPLPYLPDT